MTKAEYMALAEARYDELQSLNQLDDFYNYEKEFVTIWRDLGRQVLEKNIGDPLKDHRKKKMVTTTLGKISLNNTHRFSRLPFGFRYSGLMQELIVYAGTLDVYAKSREVLLKFTAVQVSDVQVWRISECYGGHFSDESDALLQRSLPPLSASDTLYVEADGSMILSRDAGYKEVKVARLFKASDCLHPQGKPGFIKASQYMASLENSQSFCADMEKLLEDYGARPGQLVFISDGAPWLRNWIADAYPGSTSVLDFYHATEHLYAFCEHHFKDQQQGERWAAQQRELLLDGGAAQVICNIEAMGGDSEACQSLVAYYRSNEGRMDYKAYRGMGCGIIGSGAIESAHRTLVQKRMKLSGQRWGLNGAGHMLELRTIHMNGQWNKVIELAKTTTRKAA